MSDQKLNETKEIVSMHKNVASSSTVNNCSKALFSKQPTSASSFRKSKTRSALKKSLKLEKPMLKQIKSNPSSTKNRSFLQPHFHEENRQLRTASKFKEEQTIPLQNITKKIILSLPKENEKLTRIITYDKGKLPSNNMVKSSWTKTINCQEKIDLSDMSNEKLNISMSKRFSSRVPIKTNIKKREFLKKEKDETTEDAKSKDSNKVFATKKEDNSLKSKDEGKLSLETKSTVANPRPGKDNFSCISKILQPSINSSTRSESIKVIKVNSSTKKSPYSASLKFQPSKSAVNFKQVQKVQILEEVKRNLSFFSSNFSRPLITEIKNSNLDSKLRNVRSARGQVYGNVISKSAVTSPKISGNRRPINSYVEYKISENCKIPVKQIPQSKSTNFEKKNVTEINSTSGQRLTQKFNRFSKRVESPIKEKDRNVNELDQKIKSVSNNTKNKHESESAIKRVFNEEPKSDISSIWRSIGKTEANYESTESKDLIANINSKIEAKKKAPDKVEESEMKEEQPTMSSETEDFLKLYGPSKTFVITTESCRSFNEEVEWVETELWSENLEKAFIRGRAIGLSLLQARKVAKQAEQKRL